MKLCRAPLEVGLASLVREGVKIAERKFPNPKLESIEFLNFFF